jgi:hypothetical protein
MCHDLDLDVMPPSCIGEHSVALLVRSLTTTSRLALRAAASGGPPWPAMSREHQ